MTDVLGSLRDIPFKLRLRFLLKLWQWGIYKPPDRRLLERAFLPALSADPDIKRVLFVGVANYCDYRRCFERAEYITIDPNVQPGAAGGKEHIQDTLQNLGRHFPKDHFDLIILNGVIGWGLNDPGEIERAIQAAHIHLRDCGMLLIGLNETGGPVRASLNSIRSLVLFVPVNLPTLSVSRIDFAHPFDRDFTFAMFQKCKIPPQKPSKG
jgi:hypothetical protein